jgi:hypothetical protein
VALLRRGKGRAPTTAELDGLHEIGYASVAFGTEGWICTGVGSVCLRPTEGSPVVSAEMSTDEFGHTWLTRRAGKGDLVMMASELRGICTAVEEAKLGQSLLCAIVPFRNSADESMAMIYRFKRSAWYPFVPSGEHQRDNGREIGLQAALSDHMTIDSDLTKWSPLWGAPGMPRVGQTAGG